MRLALTVAAAADIVCAGAGRVIDVVGVVAVVAMAVAVAAPDRVQPVRRLDLFRIQLDNLL